MPSHPRAAARLHSLIGDGMHDLPPEVIHKLERMLQCYGVPHPRDEPAWGSGGGLLRTPREVARHLDGCLVESGGDAPILAEALLNLVEGPDLRRVARVCGLPSDVLHRQLAGRRTLAFATVAGTLRALGVELRVQVAAR